MVGRIIACILQGVSAYTTEEDKDQCRLEIAPARRYMIQNSQGQAEYV